MTVTGRQGKIITWTLSGAVAACVVAYGLIFAQASAATDVRIQFDGGHAFVFSDGERRVDVGPVRRPGGAEADHFNLHVMRLRLDKGVLTAVPGLGTITQSGATAGDPWWALGDREILVCPDGECPTESTLEVSQASKPATSCTPGDEPVDNLHYVPDLVAMHPGSSLVSNWREKLRNVIVLRNGRLQVHSAMGCFTLRNATGERSFLDSIAAGKGQIHYIAPAKNFLDIKVLKLSDGSVLGGIRILPDAEGLIQLNVTTMYENYDTERPLLNGAPIAHFRQFYHLLAGVPVDRRFELLYTPNARGEEISPGTECPNVRFYSTGSEDKRSSQ